MTSDLQAENERLRLEISNLKKLVIRLYCNITKAKAHRVVESAVLDSQNGVSLLPTQGHNMKEMNMNFEVIKMNFGEAIEALKSGKKVARSGWNGKDMWLILVSGTKDAKLNKNSAYYHALQTDCCDILPHIDMWTVDSNGSRAMLPGWLASQTDMLSEDWYIVV
jgi:hypothetical protein